MAFNRYLLAYRISLHNFIIINDLLPLAIKHFIEIKYGRVNINLHSYFADE